ncbi:MAG TPA: hypothetical protein PKG48_03855 [Bacteroidales bacterium]|nr:hypothetical protein [Bacteroidales bacterium]
MIDPRRLLHLVFILVVGFTGCSKDDESNLLMIVYPTTEILSAHPDTLLRFTINANSDSPLDRVRLSLDRTGKPRTTLLDTVPGKKEFSYPYDFHVTNDMQGENMVLTFYCSNEAGKTFSILKRLYVIGKEEPLKETSGHVMFSRQSLLECAYDLITGEGVSFADTIHPHDIEDHPDSLTSQAISRSWISPFGNQFVVFNEFDYANATNVSATNGYNSGIKLTELHNLAVGNIILTRITRGNFQDYCVVIRITAIIDNPGTGNDYYMFNLKKP